VKGRYCNGDQDGEAKVVSTFREACCCVPDFIRDEKTDAGDADEGFRDAEDVE
jgi:hypothetical protein